MNTTDRKENQFVLIEFSEELQAFKFNLDGADKTAPSYMPIVWLPHLDAVRWTQEMKNLLADHRLTLEEVVERSMTPLVRLGTIKLECVRHMHKIRRDEVDGLSDEKRDEFFDQLTQEAKKFMLDDIFHTRLVEAGVYDNPDNKDIIVWAEVFVGVKDGIDIDKELAGEIKPVSRHLNLKSIGDTPVPEKIAGLGDPIVIEIPDAVETAKNFDPYPPLDQETVEKTFEIVYPEGCSESEKQVLYHIVLEHSGLLTSEVLVEYATDKDSEFLRREMVRELCDVMCRAWVNNMPGGTFMDHRPHVKVDYSEYVKGNGGKIIVEFSTEFLH